MKGTDLLCAMSYVDIHYLEKTGEQSPGKRGALPLRFARYASLAACLAILVTLGAQMGRFWGNTPNPQPPVIPAVTGTQQPGDTQRPADTPDPLQPPAPQQVTINWAGVRVNESDGLGPDGARRYYDPALYDMENLDTDGVRDYYGWELAPAYIPAGLTAGGQGPGGFLCREKASGEVVEDNGGRGFWSGFWEDGSPKSGDDLYIPTGFTIRASRLAILHCALLPVDSSETTDFGGVSVTISHSSMKHGPFDPTQKAPDGLSNMPAGYYDIYTAAFELDGVKYEVMAQRLEAEELIKIVASIITPYEDMTVGGTAE